MMNISDGDSKRENYSALVQGRKACRACVELTNPSVCEGGIFDCDGIGAWSSWQGNIDSPLIVVGQDWGDVASFIRKKGRSANTNPTNKTLLMLLASIGFDAKLPKDTSGEGTLFFTNAILCLKKCGAQSAVKKEWFRNCGSCFLRPSIDLVKPKVVVCLGDRAYRAVLDTYGIKPLKFSVAVSSQEPAVVTGSTAVFPVYHCGIGTQNRNRNLEAQLGDWKRIAEYLARAWQCA